MRTAALVLLLAWPIVAHANPIDAANAALARGRAALTEALTSLPLEVPPSPVSPDGVVRIRTAATAIVAELPQEAASPPPPPVVAAPQRMAAPAPAPPPPPAPATIQTTQTTTSAAFTDALLGMLTLLSPLIAAFAVAALKALADKLKVQWSIADAAKMESEINAALAVGIVKAGDKIKALGLDHPEAQVEILTEGSRYLKQRFPDRAKQITAAAGGADRGAVTETLSGRLPAAIADARRAADPTPVVVVKEPIPDANPLTP